MLNISNVPVPVFVVLYNPLHPFIDICTYPCSYITKRMTLVFNFVINLYGNLVGRFSGFLADRNKHFETARGELTPDVGQKEGVETSLLPKPTAMESQFAKLGEEMNSPGRRP